MAKGRQASTEPKAEQNQDFGYFISTPDGELFIDEAKIYFDPLGIYENIRDLLNEFIVIDRDLTEPAKSKAYRRENDSIDAAINRKSRKISDDIKMMTKKANRFNKTFIAKKRSSEKDEWDKLMK